MKTARVVLSVAATLGLQTSWNDVDQTTTFQSGSITVVLQIASNEFMVNNEIRQLPVAPRIIAGRTYVPVTPVAGAFGCWVQAELPESRVDIITPGQILSLAPLPEATKESVITISGSTLPAAVVKVNNVCQTTG